MLLTLSEIGLQAGNRAAAQAREIMEFASDHINDEELGASFLAKPEVRRVMSG